jgi:hypothetical protein
MKTILSALFISLLFVHSSHSQPLASGPSFLGSWEGSMMMGRDDMTLALTVSEENGALQARLTSAGLGLYGMPADLFMVDGSAIKAVFERIGAEFTGKLRLGASGNEVLRIDGDWFQSAEMVPISLLPVSEPSF